MKIIHKKLNATLLESFIHKSIHKNEIQGAIYIKAPLYNTEALSKKG